MRVVVPDPGDNCAPLSGESRGAVAGDPDAAQRYEWMILELLDQMVRDEGGGEMLKIGSRIRCLPRAS